jgi:lipid-binding SYLF domain-containing protein
MKKKLTIHLTGFLVVALVALGASATGRAQSKDDSKLKDEIQQSEKAATVFSEIMNTPDKGIPKQLFDSAKCVVVFPNVLKAGFIVGGRGGRGVGSCKNGGTWSSPAYFNLGGGSVGLQIGAESTDFVLLVMNDKGMNSLLSDSFTLGGDASVAAGPVGRQAGAETDLKLNAEILSYSRSKGLFGGLELKGVVIHSDKDDMKDVYGSNVTAKEVLNGTKTATAATNAFPNMLKRFSTTTNASAK